MNKVVVTMITIIVIISAIFTAIAIVKSEDEGEIINEESKVVEEEILDDCTEQYEMMQTQVTNANSEQEKTSPNCSLTIKTYFKKCEHITSEYLNLPQEFVNLTKEQIQEKYPQYEIQTFSSNEIVLYQEKEEECGEHYLVKDNNGIVTIYKILEDGSLEEQEETSISTEYLPENDKQNMIKGIKIKGKMNLNQLLEDYE